MLQFKYVAAQNSQWQRRSFIEMSQAAYNGKIVSSDKSIKFKKNEIWSML
jgi:hypothetical protein